MAIYNKDNVQMQYVLGVEEEPSPLRLLYEICESVEPEVKFSFQKVKSHLTFKCDKPVFDNLVESLVAHDYLKRVSNTTLKIVATPWG